MPTRCKKVYIIEQKVPTLSIINSVILRFDTSTGSLRQAQCAAVGETQRAVIVNCSLSIVHCPLKHVCQPHQRIESLCAVVVPDVVALASNVVEVEECTEIVVELVFSEQVHINHSFHLLGVLHTSNKFLCLQVVANTGDVGGDLVTIGQADTGDFTERGVRLLGRGGTHCGADARSEEHTSELQSQ